MHAQTPQAPAADRVRAAWQSRNESDYIFAFASAMGWTLLTCGIYSFYVFYQLMRRMRDHNRRRLELLDAATAFAWERAETSGAAEELRPNFERIGAGMGELRAMTTEFRDPVIWTLLAVVTSGIAHIVGYILLDGDLVRHDRAEVAIEGELATIYARLGASVPQPDPGRVKGKHNYVGRIIATVLTCGIYGLWWINDLMQEPNRHFEQNWTWEDSLAQAVQQLQGA